MTKIRFRSAARVVGIFTSLFHCYVRFPHYSSVVLYSRIRQAADEI